MPGPAIMLASALAPVTVPYDVQRRLFDTYPTWAVQQSRSSGTQMEAIVEPDGRVRQCTVVAFVGSEKLANEECTALSRRKLRPANDPDGRPTVGLFRTNISRYIRGRSPEIAAVRNWRIPADVAIPADRHPDPSKGQLEFGLALFVGADGLVVACEEIVPDGEAERVPGNFIQIACADASKERRRQLTTADGQPTAYVANVKVRFEAPVS